METITEIIAELDDYLGQSYRNQIIRNSEHHEKIKKARKMLSYTLVNNLELEITRLREEVRRLKADNNTELTGATR